MGGDLDEGRAEPNSPLRLAGKQFPDFLSTTGAPLGSLPFYRELPVRLRDCRRALPLGATAGALYLPAGVSGAKRSERRQRAGRGAERSEAERSPPCPPSMSLPVLSCLCSLLSPCLLVELSCRYAPLSGGSSLLAVSLLAGLGSSPGRKRTGELEVCSPLVEKKIGKL